MKSVNNVILATLVASVSALPVTSTNLVAIRDCTPGRLVCNGSVKFGLCDLNRAAVWMKVAEGTECACQGDGCSIVYAHNGAPVEAQPTPDTPASPPATQQAPPTEKPADKPADKPTSPPASAPVTPEAPATSSAPAEESKPAGVFIENPGQKGKQPEQQPAPTTSAPPTSEPASEPAPKQPETSSSPATNPSSGGSAGKSYMKTFLGTGNPSQGWPQLSQWSSFNSMWTANLGSIISQSCAGFGQANNSPQESADLKSAIQSVGQESGVDPRFILAVVMQESNGCVRAPTTNYGVTNPGLMQSHNGAHSCYNVSPCSSSEIKGMISDGVNGTADGDGLKQLLAQAGGSSEAEKYYRASRMYNSGSVASSGLLQDGIATHCYVSDIANRLMGWSQGVGGCHI
ncbi:hypothetical protein Golomagni_06702 [Golovinomyces magnicellulatus]|nr:hypothetical protein Golomagni_06702 [Golovinomyces magnicellulatus]